jgi:hypothetical protein
MGPPKAVGRVSKAGKISQTSLSNSEINKKDNSITIKKTIKKPKVINLKVKKSSIKNQENQVDIQEKSVIKTVEKSKRVKPNSYSTQPGSKNITSDSISDSSSKDLNLTSVDHNSLLSANSDFFEQNQVSDSENNLDFHTGTDNIIPKPILAYAKFDIIKRLVNACPLSQPAKFKLSNIIKNNTISQHRVCIYTSNINDKSTVKKQLSLAKINYNSYTEREFRDNCFVLKNFIKKSEPEIIGILRTANIPVSRVQISNISSDNPTYFVYVPPNFSLVDILKYHHTIDQIEVKWEKFDSSRKPLCQCHNCQRWGHAQGNCGFAYRCICCPGSHEKGSCPRQLFTSDQKREIPPFCVNCSGNHSANFKRCPTYLEYAARANSNTNELTKKLLKSKIAILSKVIETRNKKLALSSGNKNLSIPASINSKYRLKNST